MKLYQKILKKLGWFKEEKEEISYYNPLNLKLESNLSFDHSIDSDDKIYKVTSIEENTVLGEKFTDYHLEYKGLSSKDDDYIILRAAPDDESDSGNSLLLLVPQDSFGYSDDFQAVFEDESNKFIVSETFDDDDPTNDVISEYWRINGNSIPLYIECRKINKNGVSVSDLEMRDFSRLTEIDGVEKEEYLFIDKNLTNGCFKILVGFRILNEFIKVY